MSFFRGDPQHPYFVRYWGGPKKGGVWRATFQTRAAAEDFAANNVLYGKAAKVEERPRLVNDAVSP